MGKEDTPMSNQSRTTQNNDTGSLLIGAVEAKVGDVLFIDGETKGRPITYLMGKGAKQHACCKGSGPFPTGLVSFSLGAPSAPQSKEETEAQIAALQEQLAQE
jgi:hypothetical protein